MSGGLDQLSSSIHLASFLASLLPFIFHFLVLSEYTILSFSLFSISISWRSRDREWSCSSRCNVLLSSSPRVTKFPFSQCVPYSYASCVSAIFGIFVPVGFLFFSCPALERALMMNWSCSVVGWRTKTGFRPGSDEKRSIILTYSTTNVWRLTSRFVYHQTAIRKRWRYIERDSRRSDSDPTKCSSVILPCFFSANVGSINMKWRNLFF